MELPPFRAPFLSYSIKCSLAPWTHQLLPLFSPSCPRNSQIFNVYLMFFSIATATGHYFKSYWAAQVVSMWIHCLFCHCIHSCTCFKAPMMPICKSDVHNSNVYKSGTFCIGVTGQKVLNLKRKEKHFHPERKGMQATGGT